ncbi:MAG: GNAT family N-acetyltransferase [Catenulispora sp.]|nr:GNAT family N-acetyltransferase [Catenulispora sp.]
MSEQTIVDLVPAPVLAPPDTTAERVADRPPRLEVREILTPADAKAFTALLLKELPSHYDEVDATFPESILSNARNGQDPFGYFTLSKNVYTTYVDGRLAGFTVVTMKRGGSAKIGPTAVLPEFRRTGIASALRDIVERKLYEGLGVRKLYMTVSASNVPALLFNLDRGFKIEGILRGQYRRDQDEFVLGAFNPAGPPAVAAAETRYDVEAARGRWNDAVGSTAALWTDPDVQELRAFLSPRLQDSFDQLDIGFYQAIVDACRESRQTYHQKGKRLLAARTDGVVSAVAVYVPKRGGGAKLSPCVADNADAARALIAEALELAASEGRRKIYIHVPDTRFDMVALLVWLGFAIEAQLREAYRPGTNIIVLGRLLP